MTTELTNRQLNRSTLERQMLLQRSGLDAARAVERVVALQAQEAASPYLALWNRVVDFDPADLDKAFGGQSVIKASLMRNTLHAVSAADYLTFHHALQPNLRRSRLGDARFARLGLSESDADALVPRVLAFADRARTNAEFHSMLDEHLGVELPPPGLWWALRMFAPVVHAPTGPPWSFGPRPSYVAAPVSAMDGDPVESFRELVRRYLAGFGPAGAVDVVQFAQVSRSMARDALSDQELVRLTGPGGVELFDIPGGRVPDPDTPAPPRLMAMWDSILLAYADRGRVIPPDYRRLIIRNNGDTLPTLLVDGFVAGVWRPVEGGIEATAFRTLSDDDWAGLATEARSLLALLAERETNVYRRYSRWWATLPAAQVRVLTP